MYTRVFSGKVLIWETNQKQTRANKTNLLDAYLRELKRLYVQMRDRQLRTIFTDVLLMN